MDKKNQKNSVSSIHIYAPEGLKSEFVKIAERKGHTQTKVILKGIRDYIKENR